MELAEIEAKVAELHRSYAEQLKNHVNNVDPITGKYRDLPRYQNLRLKPEEIPFDKLLKSPFRKFVECSVCGFDISLCNHNPFNMTAERYQKRAIEEARSRKAMELQVRESDPNSEIKVISMGFGRKRTVAVTNDIVDECIPKQKAGYPGGVSALAAEYNVNRAELYQALKAAGCVFVKGRAKGSVLPYREPRAEIVVPAEVKTSIIEMYRTGTPVATIRNEEYPEYSVIVVAKIISDAGIMRKRGEKFGFDRTAVSPREPKEPKLLKVNAEGVPRKSRTKPIPLTDAVIKECIPLFNEGFVGGASGLAAKYGVPPIDLLNALKAAGCVIAKGRIKSTQKLTDDIINKCVERFNANEGGGVVALAQEYNVPATELSAAMKMAGCVIRKGRKS